MSSSEIYKIAYHYDDFILLLGKKQLKSFEISYEFNRLPLLGATLQ